MEHIKLNILNFIATVLRFTNGAGRYGPNTTVRPYDATVRMNNNVSDASYSRWYPEDVGKIFLRNAHSSPPINYTASPPRITLTPQGTMKNKVTLFSRMLVRMYQSVRRLIPEDRHLNSSSLNMEAASRIFSYITHKNRPINIDKTHLFINTQLLLRV